MPRKHSWVKDKPHVTVTEKSIQGDRDYQEDFYCRVRTKDGRTGLVVCDGHGGAAASNHIGKYICKQMQKLKRGQSDLVKIVNSASKDWDQACIEKLRGKRQRDKEHKVKQQKYSFPKSEDEVEAFFGSVDPYIMLEYEKEGYCSGTTVLAALVDADGHSCKICHVGDSRAVWSLDGGRETGETKDHKPDASDPHVIEVEGTLRINGVLAVGRALGNNYTNLYRAVSKEVTLTSLTWDYSLLLILASDGVWDVMSGPETLRCDTVHEIVETSNKRSVGSADNITCLRVCAG